MLNGFRLSLTSGSPVSTDGTTSTTIYLTPYISGTIELYFNGRWKLIKSNEVSISLTSLGLSNNTNYDIFAYWDNITHAVKLELVAWAGDGARNIALTRQDGVLVKISDTTRRFVGTCRTVSTTQVTDSVTKRFLWNHYNRLDRAMSVVDSTNTWTFIAANLVSEWQGANGATGSNKVEYVAGDPDSYVPIVFRAQGMAHGANSLTSTFVAASGIGLFATGTNNATLYGSNPQSLTLYTVNFADLITNATMGHQTVNWLDGSNSSGIFGYVGDNGTTSAQTGMVGKIQG
jgi:hypothetical protein